MRKRNEESIDEAGGFINSKSKKGKSCNWIVPLIFVSVCIILYILLR